MLLAHGSRCIKGLKPLVLCGLIDNSASSQSASMALHLLVNSSLRQAQGTRGGVCSYHRLLPPTNIGGRYGGLAPCRGGSERPLAGWSEGEASPTFCKNQKGGIRNKPVGRSFQRSSPTLHSKRFLPQKKVCFLEKFIYNGNNYI